MRKCPYVSRNNCPLFPFSELITVILILYTEIQLSSKPQVKNSSKSRMAILLFFSRFQVNIFKTISNVPFFKTFSDYGHCSPGVVSIFENVFCYFTKIYK